MQRCKLPCHAAVLMAVERSLGLLPCGMTRPASWSSQLPSGGRTSSAAEDVTGLGGVRGRGWAIFVDEHARPPRRPAKRLSRLQKQRCHVGPMLWSTAPAPAFAGSYATDLRRRGCEKGWRRLVASAACRPLTNSYTTIFECLARAATSESIYDPTAPGLDSAQLSTCQLGASRGHFG